MLIKLYYILIVQPIESNAEDSPFSEVVMVSLAKEILNELAEGKDAGILDDDFQYSTPHSGPSSKEEFMKDYSVNLKKAFPDFSWNPQNFKLDR